MKKLLFIVLVYITSYAVAQNPIPNPGFNDWIDYGTYSDPAFWGSNNSVTASFGIKPVQSDTISVDGLSAKLVTKSGQNFNDRGVLCSNGVFDINTLGCQFGFPCNEHFDYFNGYAMYNPTGVDTGGIAVQLWKWDVQTKTRQYVATTSVTFTSTNSQFAFFSVPFDYINSDTPDSAMIKITSSTYAGASPPAGSKLRVDNFEFSAATAVQNLEKIDLSIFPNPTNDFLSIHIPPTSEQLFISVFDFTGRLVKKSALPANEYRFSTKTFVSGIYYLQVTDRDNKPMTGTTFEVHH